MSEVGCVSVIRGQPCISRASAMLQERTKELTAHEQQLEEWRKQFKSEALRQIREREKALTEWQAQLDAKRSELEDLKKNVEVKFSSS